MEVIPVVVELHAEEAGLLWLRRDHAAGQPHFTLADLAALDDHLDAQLDGLRVAESEMPGAGWEICNRTLSGNEPGEVFPAAILAWEGHAWERIDRVIEAARQSHECFRALVSSLGWLTEEQAQPHIARLLASSEPFELGLGISACMVRGRDPGEALTKAVASRDGRLKARALAAIGESARRDLLPAATGSFDSPEAAVREAAVWSVARLTVDETALELLKAVAESRSGGAARAMQLVLRRMNPGVAAKWLRELAQRGGELVRTAVIGTGIVGLSEAVPWLLQMMFIPALARVAGEAFSMITGIDLAASKLESNWPAGFTAGPTEDPADDNVEMDPDENVPWPDAARLATWWEQHRGDFEPGVRYLCGRPLAEDSLEDVLRRGYQRQRAAAALELALLRPDKPLFNVRSPGRRQQELLGLNHGGRFS